jgi:hypothetical protein
MVATGSTRSSREINGSRIKAVTKGGVSRENKKFRNHNGIDGS